MIRGASLVTALTLATGCGSPFEFEVDVGRNNAPAGVEVRIDGAAIPDEAYRVTYDTFADSQAAPPLAIEVWRGGAPATSLDLHPTSASWRSGERSGTTRFAISRRRGCRSPCIGTPP